MAITPSQAINGPYDPNVVALLEKTIDDRIGTGRGFVVSAASVKLTIDPKIKGSINVQNISAPPSVMVRPKAADVGELKRRYQLAGWADIQFRPIQLGLEVTLIFQQALPVSLAVEQK